MLTKKDWDKLKKKLSKIPPERRIKELKILLVQTVDKKIIKEAKDLIDKAVLEIQTMAPLRDATGEITIISRLEQVERAPVRGELEERVASVPIQPVAKDETEVKYEAGGEYKGKGYFSESYEGKGYKTPSVEKASQEAEMVEDVKKKLKFEQEYTQG